MLYKHLHGKSLKCDVSVCCRLYRAKWTATMPRIYGSCWTGRLFQLRAAPLISLSPVGRVQLSGQLAGRCHSHLQMGTQSMRLGRFRLGQVRHIPVPLHCLSM